MVHRREARLLHPLGAYGADFRYGGWAGRGPPHPKDVAVNNRCGNEIGDFTTPEYSVAPDIVGCWRWAAGLDTNGAAIYGTT